MSSVKERDAEDLPNADKEAEVHGPDETTPINREADRATQTILAPTELHYDAVPANAPAPLFKINEQVFFKNPYADRGGTIVASTWKNETSSFVYEIASKQYVNGARVKDITEARILSSQYAVGDVVVVEAFGKRSRRTIEKVLVDANGVFSYDIGGGFQAREVDVLKVAGRRG